MRRTFGSKVALDRLDLSVAPGTVTGLLGTNGSGKSTSLKLLSGVLRPSGGTALLNGVSLTQDPLEFKRRSGYVPDVGGLFPRLTGWEHLELAARLRGMRNWDGRARHLLELLELDADAGLRAQNYSHGMSRKLSTAIATLSEPELLLLDEPYDGVDPIGADAISGLIDDARTRGASVLVCTHLLDVAERLADSLVVVRRGRVVAQGSTRELLELTGEPDLANAYQTLLRRA